MSESLLRHRIANSELLTEGNPTSPEVQQMEALKANIKSTQRPPKRSKIQMNMPEAP